MDLNRYATNQPTVAQRCTIFYVTYWCKDFIMNVWANNPHVYLRNNPRDTKDYITNKFYQNTLHIFYEHTKFIFTLIDWSIQRRAISNTHIFIILITCTFKTSIFRLTCFPQKLILFFLFFNFNRLQHLYNKLSLKNET